MSTSWEALHSRRAIRFHLHQQFSVMNVFVCDLPALKEKPRLQILQYLFLDMALVWNQKNHAIHRMAHHRLLRGLCDVVAHALPEIAAVCGDEKKLPVEASATIVSSGASSGSPIDSVVSTRLSGKQGARDFTLLSKRNLKCAIPFDWNTGLQGFASSATTATSNFE